MKLAQIFADHAVFQRDKEISIFGTGKGKITVELCGTVTEHISESDSFLFYLPPMQAGGPYEMSVDADGEKYTIHDVMIGDVIFCGGQSNMEFMLQYVDSFGDACDNENVRLYHAKKISEPHIYDNMWNVLSKESSGNWSAIAFHIANILNKQRGVAIGVVLCSQGASAIQSHMSPAITKLFDFPKDKLHPDHTFVQPPYNFEIFNHPSDIHNFMIKPVVPYTISSLCWYQGESNSSPYEAMYYDEMMKALFLEFRHLFRSEKLPIVAVQINNYDTPFSKEGWKKVQEAQVRAANELDFCELVTITDLGEYDLIHPLNKKAVAERICEKLCQLNAAHG